MMHGYEMGYASFYAMGAGWVFMGLVLAIAILTIAALVKYLRSK